MPAAIERIIELNDRWDFSIVSDGSSYLTRRPMVGEIAALTHITTFTRAELDRLATELIVDGPDVSVWHARKLAAFFSGYLEFFRRKIHVKEKRGESSGIPNRPGEFAQKFSVIVLKAGIARDWQDALTMPADWAINLLDQMNRNSMNKPRRDKTETMPDGSKKISFGSIEALSQALAAEGWSGVRLGR